MSSETLKQYLPSIKKALLVNSALILYFALPNFTSFALISLLATLFINPRVIDGLCNCEENSKCGGRLNKWFNQYLSFDWVRKLIIIVGAGLIAQLTYFLPSWFILLLAAQVYAFSDILIGLGLIQVSEALFGNMQNSIKKFVNLIPRYQG